MNKATHQTDPQATKMFLTNILSSIMTDKAGDQLSVLMEQVGETEQAFQLAFSNIPRITGKDLIVLQADQDAAAHALRAGFTLQNWRMDQAARVLLIITLVNKHPDTFKKTLDKAFSVADVSELVALYAALPLLPSPQAFTDRAAEGIRNNMTVVFDAVALNNPYPADHLSEAAWNQLILKAVFNNRSLNAIYGIDRRANKDLAQMLVAYAHERWAAGRMVTPELWRCVGPFIEDHMLPDIQKIFSSPNILEQQAGALACAASTNIQVQALLNTRTDLKQQITTHALNWQKIADGISTH